MTTLGIDIGGSSVKLAIVESGKTLWTGQSAAYSRPTTDELIAALRAAAGERTIRVATAGLCVPGLLDKPRRTITLAVNVPGLIDVPLDELIGRALGATGDGGAIGRMAILNDAVAAATDLVATRRLTGRVLAIALGTGVGAAVLDNGVPLVVEGDSPGHIGQFDVSVPGDEVIGPDGGRGSLEGYIGAPALVRRYGLDMPANLARLTVDDPPIRALARAIRLCHAMYRPNHVALLGGIGIRIAHLLPRLKQAIDDRLTAVARGDWTLSTGDNDFHAALGAARLAIDVNRQP